MSMWLYDDIQEMEDFQLYQKEVRLVEREYLELRVPLCATPRIAGITALTLRSRRKELFFKLM